MFLNLKQVQQRDNALGLVIVRGYKNDPGATLSLIREHYETNPASCIETIGLENATALGLLNPVHKFLYHYPVKGYQEGHFCIIFNFKTFAQLFGGMQRAKHIIEDLRLDLKVRALSHNGVHKLYIDHKLENI